MKPVLESKDVTVLIVNYRGADDTINCLRSLNNLAEAPGRIIVIDNNSNDGSVDKIFFEWSKFATPVTICEENIQTEYIKSKYIIFMSKINGGYSHGNNIGIKISLMNTDCKYIWILNNDTIVDENSLKYLLDKFHYDKKYGIIGSTLIDINTKKIQCAGGGRISKVTGKTYDILNSYNTNNIKFLNKDIIEQKLHYINGASMLISRDVFEYIGIFDENYFMYYEDVDFCMRASKKIKLGWAYNSIVYHKQGSSSNIYSKKIFSLHSRKRIMYKLF